MYTLTLSIEDSGFLAEQCLLKDVVQSSKILHYGQNLKVILRRRVCGSILHQFTFNFVLLQHILYNGTIIKFVVMRCYVVAKVYKVLYM